MVILAVNCIACIYLCYFIKFIFVLFTSHPRLDPVPVHHPIQRLIPRTHPGPFHKERLVTCLTFESSDIYVTTHNRRLFCCHRNLDQRDRSPRLRHSLNATSSLSNQSSKRSQSLPGRSKLSKLLGTQAMVGIFDSYVYHFSQLNQFARVMRNRDSHKI